MSLKAMMIEGKTGRHEWVIVRPKSGRVLYLDCRSDCVYDIWNFVSEVIDGVFTKVTPELKKDVARINKFLGPNSKEGILILNHMTYAWEHCDDGWLYLGCERRPISHWLDNYRQIAENHDHGDTQSLRALAMFLRRFKKKRLTRSRRRSA